MKNRFAELLAGEDASAAATKTVDINVKDVISRIAIRFKGTNNGSSPTAHPAAMISKIELVDGSDVLFSCSGYEAEAVDHYDRKRNIQRVLDYVDNEMAIPVLNLNFGRRLWDKELALDPKKFNNLQLKITHNKASGGSAPDAGNIRVMAMVFDENQPAPIGFLQTKEYYSYTLTASAYEHIDLPVDLPIRKLVVFGRSGGKQPWEQVNQIKLSINNDKRVPLDVSVSDWLPYMSSLCPPVIELMRCKGTASTALAVYVTPTYDVVIVPTAALTAGHFLSEESYGGSGSITPEQSGDIMCAVHGWVPHGGILVPMCDQDEINEFYEPPSDGSLRLRLKAGSSPTSSSTSEVVIQQLRRY